MFLGEFEYRVDEKGRLPIPPRFKRELERQGLVLSSGPDRCIVAYGQTEWKKWIETLTSATVAPSKLRRLNRALFASAFNLNLDGQGRIALPVPLRHFAGIDDEVVIVGANTFFEVWNKGQWEAEKAIAQDDMWQIIEGLERR